MGLFDSLGFAQPDPNNPFQQQAPSTTELILRLAQNLGPLAPYIGGHRTPLGRMLGGGSVLAGGLSGTAADLLAQQRLDPVKQQMLMAQQALNMGNQAVVPKIDLANSQFTPPAEGTGFAPAPMNPGQGGFAPRMPTSPFGSVTPQELVAATKVPGLAPFIDPNKLLTQEYLKKQINAPIHRDIHTELRDPNDPTKIIAPAGLTQAEQEKEQQAALYKNYTADVADYQKATGADRMTAAATVLDDPAKPYGGLPTNAEFGLVQAARTWQQQKFSADTQQKAQTFSAAEHAKTQAAADARADAREAQRRAHENRLLDLQQNPIIPSRDAGLYVDPNGNSLKLKDVAGKRVNDLPAGAVRANNAQEIGQIKSAKAVVGLGEQLRTLSPQILKQYGGRSLGQLFAVQGNRIVIKSDKMQGDPTLKKFTTILNDYQVNLPQAQGIPGGRESNALIERFASGTPGLADTVQSLNAAVEGNMQSLNMRWGSRGIDLTPEGYVKPIYGPPGTAGAAGANPYSGMSNEDFLKQRPAR